MLTIRFLPLVFIIISTLIVKGQSSQEAAKEVILKSVAKYKTYTTAYITFNYIIENRGEEYKEQQKGNVYLNEGKFNLSIGDQVIISDHVLVWTYLKEANEVQISKYDPDELEINPSEIFTMWETGFMYRYVEDVTINNIVYSLIELTPENKNLSYFKVKLLVDKKTGDIFRIQTFYKNSGLILTFEILSVLKNPKLSDKMFKFEVKSYPGIEIIDLTK